MTHRATTKQGRKPRKPSLLLRVLPSLTDVAFLMPVIFLFYKLDGVKTLLGDGDTGWHLRAGEWMIANGAVPTTDLFSFTKPDSAWYAWEWGWDVIFGWLHQSYGMAAVVLPSIALICFTSAWLYRVVRRASGNVIISIALTLLAVAATSIHWLARPHLVTLLFVVAMLDLLERTRRDGRLSRLVWTVPMTAVWVNLHGGFFVGVVILGCYAAGALTEAAIAPDAQEREPAWGRAKAFSLAALGCSAASLLNPYGWKLHQHIAAYLTESYHFDHINEFQSTSFHGGGSRYFEIYLALAALAVVYAVARRNMTPLFLVAGWAHLALISARNIPIFVLIAAPFCAEAIVAMIERVRTASVAKWLRSAVDDFEDFASDMHRTDAPARFHFVSVGAFLLLMLLVFAPNQPSSLRAEYDPRSYPEAALAAIDEMGAVRIFTDDEWGDYVIYSRHDKHRVFMDGRSDFYGAELGLRYLDAMSAMPGWRNLLDEYEIDTVLLSPKAALSSAMKETAQWRVVYDDGLAVVFRRDEPGGGASLGQGAVVESRTSLVPSQAERERSSWNNQKRSGREPDAHL